MLRCNTPPYGASVHLTGFGANPRISCLCPLQPDQADSASASTGKFALTAGTEASSMFAAVGLQVASIALLGLVTWGVFGSSSAWFLVLGGAAAIIPNSLFALRLAMHRGRPAESYPVVFFLGEFAKIGLTIALLAGILRWQADIRWLPLTIGLIVALKAPLFALLIHRERS